LVLNGDLVLRGRHHHPPRNLEPPGSTDPGRATFAMRPATPDRPRDAPLDRFRFWARAAFAAPSRTGGSTIMAAKPKPQPTDEAREQARRALQTSLDTRQ
jgi:hypothetical protein